MLKHTCLFMGISFCLACTTTTLNITIDESMYTKDSLRLLPSYCRKHKMICGEMLMSYSNKENHEYTKANIHSCMMWLYYDMEASKLDDIVENRTDKEFNELYKDLYTRCYEYISTYGDSGMIEIKKNIEKVLPYIKEHRPLCDK